MHIGWRETEKLRHLFAKCVILRPAATRNYLLLNVKRRAPVAKGSLSLSLSLQLTL